jgi:hypothetical protein
MLTLMLQGWAKVPLRLLHLRPIQRIIEFLASAVRERCDSVSYTPPTIFRRGPKKCWSMPTEALQLTAGLAKRRRISRFPELEFSKSVPT